MALQQQIWIKDIQELLYPPSSIMNQSEDMTQFLHYQTVHVPQAGLNGTVIQNRALNGSLANTYQRTDSDYTFNINSYSTAPVIISELETYQLSYDKRKSILYNSMKQMEQVMGNGFLYAIAPLTSSTLTTGAYSGTSLAFNASGVTATGTRRQMTFQDVMTLKGALDKQFVELEDRVLIAPSDIYNNELLQIPTLLNAFQYGTLNLGEAVAPTGVVARVAGFDVYERPTTVIYTSGATSVYTLQSNLDGTNEPVTVNATDSWGVLAWHPKYVGWARGSVDVFYQEVAAQAYGSILSFMVWAGGAKLRSDGKGITVIVQSN